MLWYYVNNYLNMLFLCYVILMILIFYGLCSKCRPLGRACGKCDTSKGRTDKVRGTLTLV